MQKNCFTVQQNASGLLNIINKTLTMHCYGNHLESNDLMHNQSVTALSCLAPVVQVLAVQTVALKHLLASRWILHDKHVCLNTTSSMKTCILPGTAYTIHSRKCIPSSNGQYSRTTWVSWYQNGNQLWILMQQTGTPIHAKFQSDHHHQNNNTQFLQDGSCPTNSVKATKVTFCDRL